MTKSLIPTPEEALALQNIMPQGPMPTPAGNGYAQWAADPQNSQKIINSLVPPGQSIMPAQPPPPPAPSPANPSPGMPDKLFHWTPPNLPPQNPKGQTSPGNINVLDRPIVQNPDGSSSTVRSMSYGDDSGEHLIPTVSDGADGRPPHVMGNKEAISYAQRTGQNLGNFDSPNDATAYAQSLHLQQAGMDNFGGRTSMPPQMTSENLQAPTLPQGNPMGVNPEIQQSYAPYAQPSGSAPMPTASAIMPPSMQGEAPASPLTPPGAQPPAPNQIPQIQSYKDWAGANPDMLDKASLKGRGAGRIALGALIAGAQGFAGGLKGNPGAGVEWAQGQMQHDQNLPTINQQRYNAAVVAPAQAALALQDTNSQINQRNAAAAKSTAQAGAIGDDTKGKAKNVAEAAKLGMTPVYDESGNLASFAPDPNSPIAKKQQAALDYTHAQTQATAANEDLRKANAELARARNNPNSPAYKLAVTKAATAQQNANAATTRAQAYMGNYLQMSRGVDLQGNVLPGSTQIANDQGQQQVVGSRNASQAVKEQSNAAQFNDVHGALDNIEATGQALVHAGGSLNSPRIVKALQETKGTGPDYIQSLVKQGLNPQERDYVTSIQAAHENVQALRKSAGGTATDTAVAKLDAMIPGASTPDIDYLKRQTTQIRQTAERLGKGASTAAGGLSVRGQQNPGNAMSNPPAKGGGSLPPQAAAQLTEGMNHAFNNGQVWTKKNGVPVRVQ